MRGKKIDKYGRGSAAANGAGFVDLAPGDTFDGLEKHLRARIAEVYENRTLDISASIASERNANELAKHRARGEGEEVHKFAAKNIGVLFVRGQLGIRHFDKKAIPGQRWVVRFIRVFTPFVFDGERLLATITLKENGTGENFYSVEAVDITKDAWPERTPRGAIPEGLNAAPLLDLASLLVKIVAYYVGDCNRTKPEFVNRDESFSVVRAAELLANILKTNHQPLSTMHSAFFSLDFPGTAVVTDDGRAVSYAELRTLCDNWHREIAPRSLVFLLVRNNLESLIGYIACLNRGIVPLMLDARIDAELLGRFQATYRPNYVINCVHGRVLSDLGGPRSVAAAADTRAEGDSPTQPKAEVGPPVHPRHVDLHPDLALLITTSGSTGAPKLVRQSYRNLKSNAESIAEYLKIDATERPITTLPMNYVYGLSIINSHLIRGATILLTDKTLMQREFWNFFTEQQATSFGGVPYTYEMLDKLLFFRRKLPSLRTMTQAGGKILPELHRKFAEYAKREGKNFVVMYGASEATSRMSYLPPEHALDKVGSMGIAIPGGKFALVDDNGNEIPEVRSAERRGQAAEDRRTCAERKVSEWLQGVDDATFEAALVRLIDEKCVAGEYRFKRPEEKELALVGARQFYHEFSRKLIGLSDGRYVYFAPDDRAKKRNADNSKSWAEYAFHAVSSSGKLLDGKNFRERLYNSTKAADLQCLEGVVRAEQCMYRLIDAFPENDAVIFVGRDENQGRLEIVTRLDQFGNAEANLGEVTVIAKHKWKENPPPKFRPLTEVVETVAKHQAAGFSPSTTTDNIPNSPPHDKGSSDEAGDVFSPVGELVYEGPNVTLGYAECAADLSKGDERHGRLVTGDMAKRDAEGFYYIVGRKKRFLKIFGNRVNLDETERMIKAHFTGLECACGGVDDRMKIYVTDETLLKSVQDFVADKTHLNFTAFKVVKVDAIPKNDSGKTLYAELEKLNV